MAVPVEVPKLGNTVEECLIAKWRKQLGDPVSVGEIVADIETDKATFEVASPAKGTLLARFFDEGTLVPVFTNLFVVGEPGENVDSFRPQNATQPSARPAEARPAAAAPALAAGFWKRIYANNITRRRGSPRPPECGWRKAASWAAKARVYRACSWRAMWVPRRAVFPASAKR